VRLRGGEYLRCAPAAYGPVAGLARRYVQLVAAAERAPVDAAGRTTVQGVEEAERERGRRTAGQGVVALGDQGKYAGQVGQAVGRVQDLAGRCV
jgi:hypothetical protein